MAKEGLINNYFVWDLATPDGKSQEASEEANAFGVKHVFTIVNKNTHHDDYYHFATHVTNAAINQTYMNNIDLLNLFTLHFNQTINHSKLLSSAYDIQFYLDHKRGDFALKNEPGNPESRKLFTQTILTQRYHLTQQQIEILYWLHQGKTVHDIAKIMQFAEVTINKNIASIKNKVGCYTQFQLGEFFSRYYK
jgi:DNA-binding NarL/FixJ family response regulator